MSCYGWQQGLRVRGGGGMSLIIDDGKLDDGTQSPCFSFVFSLHPHRLIASTFQSSGIGI